MTLKYITDEIFNLAFENKEDYEENYTIVTQAINRAINTICNEIRPLVDYKTITTTQQQASQYTEYDFKELTKVGNSVVFMGFESKLVKDGKYYPLSDFTLANNYTIVLPNKSATYSIGYKKLPTLINETTLEEFEFEIDLELQVLIPLLASYYVWLDDDASKATSYYNDYENKRNYIISKTTRNIATVYGLGDDYAN